MEGVNEGRVVHYVLKNGEHRPAIVVNAWNPDSPLRKQGIVNMVVFLDGSNDGIEAGRAHLDTALQAWRTSVHYSEDKEPGTWHWPERT